MDPRRRVALLFLDFRITENVRVTRVRDRDDGAVEEFTASSSQSSVISSVVVHLCLGKHGQVFNFRLSQVRAVAANENQPGLAVTKHFASRLVAKRNLSGSHDQLQATVHRVLLLFLLSSRQMIKYKTMLGEFQKQAQIKSRSSTRDAVEKQGRAIGGRMCGDRLGKK